MAISIALFGPSASGAYVFLMHDGWNGVNTGPVFATHGFAVSTARALAVLVKLRVRTVPIWLGCRNPWEQFGEPNADRTVLTAHPTWIGELANRAHKASSRIEFDSISE
jgi:hypothetical protein